MAKVTGIGGAFIVAQDTTRLAGWYQQHLGFSLTTESGGADGQATYYQEFFAGDLENPARRLQTVFAIMPANGDTGGVRSQVMINYRVDNLDELVRHLREAGIAVDAGRVELDGQGYGKFTRLRDPEGNRIELWEHIDS